MSTEEIAELCEKRHDNVLRDARRMLEDLGLPPHDYQGVTSYEVKGVERRTTCYNLPKNLTLTLVSGYNIVMRKRIIDRWMELEQAAQRPTEADMHQILNDPNALRGILFKYTERVLELEARVEDMGEDVAAHERLTAADGSLSLTEAAKVLGIKPKEFFAWMSANRWIYRRAPGQHWVGFQTHCTAGHLIHRMITFTTRDGRSHAGEQVRVTALGMSALAKLNKPTGTMFN